MNFQTPYTELESLNMLLQSINHAPVATLPPSGMEMPTVAYSVLQTTNRGVQSLGFHCNTEYNYPLNREPDATIKVPYNTLEAQIPGCTLRGQTVYDLEKHTPIHEAGLTATKISFLLPFEELPNYIREYVMVKAGQFFQLTQGKESNVIFQYTDALVQQAYLTVLDKENELESTNLLEDTAVYDMAHQYRR